MAVTHKIGILVELSVVRIRIYLCILVSVIHRSQSLLWVFNLYFTQVECYTRYGHRRCFQYLVFDLVSKNIEQLILAHFWEVGWCSLLIYMRWWHHCCLQAQTRIENCGVHSLFSCAATPVVLKLEGYKVEEFVDGDVLEVSAGPVRICQKPLEDFLIGIFSPLIVGILALPQRLLVEAHELRGGILEQILTLDLGSGRPQILIKVMIVIRSGIHFTE